MTPLAYTFRTDTLFKMLFTKHQDLLRAFVSALLGIDVKDIGDFSVMNPEIPPDVLGFKYCRLDIHMDVNMRQVDVEVQVADEGNFRERVLYYGARLCTGALKAGEDYAELRPTILISLLGFNLFECTGYRSCFGVFEADRRECLSDKLVWHFYELRKVPEALDKDDALCLWLALFKANTEEDLAQIEALGVPVMNQAISAFRALAKSDEFRRAEEMREMARKEEAWRLGHAMRQGKEEGKAEGRAEGRAEGAAATARSVARAALQMNLSVDDVAQFCGLPRDEVASLMQSE